MRLVWTKSHLPLSVFIRWGLRQPVSHFAIVFNDNLLFQSNLLGTGLDYYPVYKQSVTVVHELEVPIDVAAEDRIYNSAMLEMAHKPYGWGAFLYLVWRGFLANYFHRPMPPRNPWWQPGSYLCVGIAQTLDSDGVPEPIRAAVRLIPDLEMITPYQLYLALQGVLPA